MSVRPKRWRRSCAVFLGACVCAPLQVLAQQVRVTGSTVVQYVEMRPLLPDSVSARSSTGVTNSDRSISMTPAIQDLSVSVWGVGRGVRGYARLRGRGVVAGEEDFWPQSGDPFDLMEGYAEINRGLLRFRGGRQWRVAGLGYYNFDGAAALVRTDDWSLEAYGGWSLARGQHGQRTGESLAAIESFVQESRALLVGGDVSYRPEVGAAVRAFYQREIRQDRQGLYSERIGADGAIRRGRVSANAAVEIDAALRRLNEARVAATITLRPDLSVGLSARRHRPFFELWTIWGAFDPVGFDEYGGGVNWRVPAWSSVLDVRTGRRSYDDHNASAVFGGVRSTGWFVSASGSTRPAPAWVVQASVGTDIGAGASRSDANLRVRREFGNDAYGGLAIQAYQSIYEFRVREGTVAGVGGDGGIRLNPRVWLAGAVTVYRHGDRGDAPTPNWSQMRASMRLDWTVGAEPASPIGTGTRR